MEWFGETKSFNPFWRYWLDNIVYKLNADGFEINLTMIKSGKGSVICMDNIRVSKPLDWPANAKECALENIYDSIVELIENPGYETKEILVSLISDYDLNQRSYLGIHRITDYEVAMINMLYTYVSIINLNTLKVYLYEIVGDTTRQHKMMSQILVHGEQQLEIEQYQYLVGPLRLYHVIYQQFIVLNNRDLVDQIIDFVNKVLLEDASEKTIFYLTHAYVPMINDISYFRSKKRTNIWAFSREELLKLFGLEAKLIKLNNESAIVSPLKGVLMTTISNYILKSRNDYNSDYICKYISKKVAKSSTQNREIWMQKIRYLNDKRELKVLPELLTNKQWLEYDWAKNIDFTPKRDYYVSSFSKTIKNDDMNSVYGECTYGYKDDRIAELLAPIRMVKRKNNKQIPCFAQVVAYDIIYSIQEAKQEIRYLCTIIDEFDLTSKGKRDFLQEILQYWMLSVKDKKWEYERERRYVLFLYDNYNYIELEREHERFLKLKTSLFVFPDFILGDNPRKAYLRIMIDNKREAISTKEYMFCEDCFSCDFDTVRDEDGSCSICGSDKNHLINVDRWG